MFYLSFLVFRHGTFQKLNFLCREPFNKTGNRYCIVSARDALFYLERRVAELIQASWAQNDTTKNENIKF
jgi:BMFP domain-containing protein YqiC